MNKINWDKADWDKQDIELSKIFGVSREAVRQARIRHGKQSLTPWKRTVATAKTKLKDIRTSDLTLEELSSYAGCQEARVRGVLKELGKDFKVSARKGGIYDWSKFPNGWRNKTDKQIAKIIGVKNHSIVTQWRYRHGYIRSNPGNIVQKVIEDKIEKKVEVAVC